MNKNTIRRICDSVDDKPWSEVRITPNPSDKDAVGALLEEMGYVPEDRRLYYVVNTQYPEDTEKTIKDTLDKGGVEYTISSKKKVKDAMRVEGFDEIREIIGDTAIVDELQQYMSTDDLEEFTDHLRRSFDMDVD